MGAVGIVVAIVVRLVMREPARGGTDARRDRATGGKAPFWGTVRMFCGDPVLLRTALGSGAVQFITYGLGNFAVLFLMREKGMALEDVALWYAVVVALAMVAAMVVSGPLLDRLTRRSRAAYGMVPAISLALALPFHMAFVWAPGWPLALALLTAVMFLNYFYLASSIALVQEQVRPNERVLSSALLLLAMNLMGLGLGPTYVGAASDFFAARGMENALQLALGTLAPAYAIAAAIFLSLDAYLRLPRRTLEAS
jgi:MFS family permease